MDFKDLTSVKASWKQWTRLFYRHSESNGDIRRIDSPLTLTGQLLRVVTGVPVVDEDFCLFQMGRGRCARWRASFRIRPYIFPRVSVCAVVVVDMYGASLFRERLVEH